MAEEVGRDAARVTLEMNGGEEVARVRFGRVEEPLPGPIVDQEDRTASAVAPMGVGNDQVQVAVIVDVDELAAGATELGEPFGELLVLLEMELAAVEEQADLVAGEN